MTAVPTWVKEPKRGTNYDEIVRSLEGYEVLDSTTCGSYQGDLVYLLRDLIDPSFYGFLVVGYGSCTGCDHLQAIEPYDENGNWSAVIAYRDELRGRIHWAPKDELVGYLELKLDKTGNDWWEYDDEVRSVMRRYIKDYLR